MSIVTFWSDGKEQTGKTISIIAVATYMAIQHNYKILLVSTSFNDQTMENCFWKEKKQKRNFGLFSSNVNTNIAMANGMDGLSKLIKSNKIAPENITNYTKIVFKDTLEVLTGYSGDKERYDDIKFDYPSVINMANKYYDLVLIDLDNKIGEEIVKEILDISNLVVVNLTQRLSSINRFIEMREEVQSLKAKKTLLLFNKYDRYSKYTVKNISRYMGEKNKVSTIPYNTLFFEACEEAKVPELFLRIKNTQEDDRNGFFLAEIRRTVENIIYRLQDLQMRM